MTKERENKHRRRLETEMSQSYSSHRLTLDKRVERNRYGLDEEQQGKLYTL